MSRRVAAWGATFRIARRDAWRNKARSSLVAVMVALPILAASSVSVLYQSSSSDPQDEVALQLGAAQASVNWSGDSVPVLQDASGDYSDADPRAQPAEQPAPKLTYAQFQQKLSAVVPAGDRVARQVVNWSSRVGVGDRLVDATVVEFDYAALGSSSPLEQVAGRAPASPGEVAVTRSMQRHVGVQIGDRLTYRSGARAAEKDFTVVGVVGGLTVLGNQQVIGLPGALLTPAPVTPSRSGDDETSTTWFVGGGTPVRWADVQKINQLGAEVLSREVLLNPQTATVDPSVLTEDTEVGISADATVATGAVVVGLVLLQIALMAGPAIAVGTRRNERGLAVVAATGGEGRHLRAVVLAGSALIGFVASVAAAALGVGLASALIPVLRNRWEVVIPRIDVHLLDLVGLVLVGTLTTFAAALLPARRVGKLDIVAALTGRRALGAPRLRVPLVGLVLVIAGLVLAWLAAGRGKQFPAVLGLGIAEIGLVIASSAVVGLAARLSARTSFAARFAFRDAARQRGRTAPAVAAVLAAVAGGMTALVYAAASVEADRVNYTSSVPMGVVDVALNPYSQAYSRDDAGVATSSLRQSLPVRDTAVVQEPPYRDYYVTVLRQCPDLAVVQNGTMASAPGSDCTGFSPWFADPAAAAVFGAGKSAQAEQIRSALAGGKVVVFAADWLDKSGMVRVTVDRPDTGESKQVTLPGVLVRPDEALSSPLIPVSRAKTLGVELEPTHVIADTVRHTTEGAESRARQALNRTGVNVTVGVERGFQDKLEWILIAYLVAAALVAMIGTFTAVGLAAAESRSDLGTLAAVGAAPGMRRRLGAAQAGAIVVPGTLLGLVSGTAAGWVLVRLNARTNSQWYVPGAWRYTIPWEATLALGVGLPALAIAVGFLTVRSRLVLVRRLGE